MMKSSLSPHAFDGQALTAHGVRLRAYGSEAVRNSERVHIVADDDGWTRCSRLVG